MHVSNQDSIIKKFKPHFIYDNCSLDLQAARNVHRARRRLTPCPYAPITGGVPQYLQLRVRLVYGQDPTPNTTASYVIHTLPARTVLHSSAAALHLVDGMAHRVALARASACRVACIMRVGVVSMVLVYGVGLWRWSWSSG